MKDRDTMAVAEQLVGLIEIDVVARRPTLPDVDLSATLWNLCSPGSHAESSYEFEHETVAVGERDLVLVADLHELQDELDRAWQDLADNRVSG